MRTVIKIKHDIVQEIKKNFMGPVNKIVKFEKF